jgi:hypothetical protein
MRTELVHFVKWHELNDYLLLGPNRAARNAYDSACLRAVALYVSQIRRNGGMGAVDRLPSSGVPKSF